MGFILRGIVQIIYIIMKKGSIKDLLTYQYHKFPLFLASLAFLHKISLCILRQIRQEKSDKWNDFISGFISGISIIFIRDNEYLRRLITIYMLMIGGLAVGNALAEKNKVECDPDYLAVAAFFAISIFWLLVFLLAHKDVAEDKYKLFNMVFDGYNDPNDNLFKDLLRKILQKS